jgi:membrane protease subunit HflK
MAWNRNQGGGQGPWGQPPSGGGRGGGRGNGGGGGDQPPDLEDLLKRGQDRLKHAFPGGLGGGAMLLLLLIILGVVWALSGFYVVGAKEQGVVLRFGKYAYSTGPGLRYHMPWPVETVLLPEVTRVFRVDVGSASNTEDGTSARAQNDDNLMLTRDRNFLVVDFTVQYQINNAKDYLFNVKNPRQAVLDVSKAAMREVVGRSDFDALQTNERTAAELQTKKIIQQTLDSYKAGVMVAAVNIQRVDPPDRALDAARDVESARQQKETLRNNAEAYQNKIIPEARGQAQRIIQEAQAYKQQAVAEAQGQSQRFDAIYAQYKKAPAVTRRRMYLETMEKVLGGMNKVVVDQKSGGVVPYLPLPALQSPKSSSSSRTTAQAGGN